MLTKLGINHKPSQSLSQRQVEQQVWIYIYYQVLMRIFEKSRTPRSWVDGALRQQNHKGDRFSV